MVHVRKKYRKERGIRYHVPEKGRLGVIEDGRSLWFDNSTPVGREKKGWRKEKGPNTNGRRVPFA